MSSEVIVTEGFIEFLYDNGFSITKNHDLKELTVSTRLDIEEANSLLYEEYLPYLDDEADFYRGLRGIR